MSFTIKKIYKCGKKQSVMELIKYPCMKLEFIKKHNLGRVNILSSGKTLEFHMVIDEDMEKNKKVMIKINKSYREYNYVSINKE